MSLVRLRPVWMTNHPPSVLWHCWLGHQTCKNNPSEMTYNVSSRMLNLTHLSLLQSLMLLFHVFGVLFGISANEIEQLKTVLGVNRDVLEFISPAVFEILGSKLIGVTTLTFHGHVTSSVTWLTIRFAVCHFYWWSFEYLGFWDIQWQMWCHDWHDLIRPQAVSAIITCHYFVSSRSLHPSIISYCFVIEARVCNWTAC